MKKLLLLSSLIFSNYLYAQSHHFEWASPLAGTGNEQGSSIAVDPNGNSYIVGTFQGTVDFDPGSGVVNVTTAGDYDIFICKLDANGGFVWVKTMGGALTDYGYGIDIDDIGNIYITGRFTGTVDFDPTGGVNELTSFGEGDIFICKYTSLGNLVYAKQLGGPYLDEGHSIVVDPNGVVYATGDFDIIADFDPSGSTYNLYGQSCTNIYVVKLDTDGNMVWAKNTSGPGQGFSIALDLQGGDNQGYVVTTGPFFGTMDFDPGSGTDQITSFGDFDAYLWKLDLNGNHVWVKQLGAPDYSISQDIDCGNGVTIDHDGNIYSTGFFIGTGDFDPGPGTFNMTSGNYDAYISKLDPNGNFIWAKKIGGISAQRGYDIATDAQGNVYTTGDFIEITDFDPGAGTHTIASTWSANSFFVQKMDPNGNFIWAEMLGGNGIGHHVEVDAAYNIYLTGLYYYGTADFDFGPGVENITAVDANDGLVYKISQPGASVEQVDHDIHISVFPNPTIQDINVNSEIEIIGIELVNNGGEIIHTSVHLDGSLASVNISELPNGIYFIKIETNKGVVNRKIVKE